MKLEEIEVNKYYYYKEKDYVINLYVCEKCKGTQKLQLIDESFIKCPECNGKGYLEKEEKGMKEKNMRLDFIIYNNKLDKYFGLEDVNEDGCHTIVPIEDLYEKGGN